MTISVSVCIVGFRNASDIATCLEALSAQTHRQFDVIICENGGAAAFSAVHAIAMRQKHSVFHTDCILAPQNDGFAAGVNRCIAVRPKSNAYWILNPDTKPHPNSLSAMVAVIEAGKCDAVGGVMHASSGQIQTCGGRWRSWLARSEAIIPSTINENLSSQSSIDANLDFISGASMLVTRQFVDCTGPMREDYFLYAEEVEWCLRARTRGMRLGFAPQSFVEHAQGATTGSAASIRHRPKLPIYLDERNKLHVVRDTTPLRLPVAIFAALGLLTLRYLKHGAFRSWRYALAGWWAGVRNQRGVPDWLSKASH